MSATIELTVVLKALVEAPDRAAAVRAIGERYSISEEYATTAVEAVLKSVKNAKKTPLEALMLLEREADDGLPEAVGTA